MANHLRNEVNVYAHVDILIIQKIHPNYKHSSPHPRHPLYYPPVPSPPRETPMRIGMDFGTTNSGVARYDGARLRHLPLDDAAPNPQVARSALYITHDRQLHFGRAAIDRFYEQNLNRPRANGARARRRN